MKLDIFDYFSKNLPIYIEINPLFIEKIKFLINKKYKTLKNFNLSILKINYGTLKHEFKKAQYHPLRRLLKITRFVGIDRYEVFKNIKGFRYLGSHRKEKVILPRKIEIDEDFVEGYALYLAEGDTGFNGKTLPRKLRFTNSNLEVIRIFTQWLKNYFPNINFYLNIILPPGIKIQESLVHQTGNRLNLDINQIKIKKDHYNKIIKYKMCCDNAILIDLVLLLENIVKKVCLGNKKLAVAYIRGMMIGEGTAYFNKSRYVRIEMKNEKEIYYLYSLFQILGYSCKPSLRSERENMWSIYIGAKQLKKFYDEIGFGAHRERQRILERAVNKKLRVNQYI